MVSGASGAQPEGPTRYIAPRNRDEIQYRRCQCEDGRQTHKHCRHQQADFRALAMIGAVTQKGKRHNQECLQLVAARHLGKMQQRRA